MFRPVRQVAAAGTKLLFAITNIKTPPAPIAWHRYVWWRRYDDDEDDDGDGCCKAEEEYQIEKGRLMQEQRAAVNAVYEKKKTHNELTRKVWDRSRG